MIEKLLSRKQKSSTAQNVLVRAPRVSILALHELAVRIESPFPLENIQVSNISATGIGFLKASVSIELPTGTVVKGHLCVGVKETPFEAKVVHQSGTIYGCVYVGETSKIQRATTEYFKIEMAALQMTKVKPNMIKPDPDGKPEWVVGADNCEIYAVRDDLNQLIRYQITFFGNHIEGERGQAPRTGQISEAVSDKPRMKGSSLVSATKVPAKDMIKLAVGFVENTQALSRDLRESISENLKSIL